MPTESRKMCVFIIVHYYRGDTLPCSLERMYLEWRFCVYGPAKLEHLACIWAYSLRFDFRNLTFKHYSIYSTGPVSKSAQCQLRVLPVGKRTSLRTPEGICRYVEVYLSLWNCAWLLIGCLHGVNGKSYIAAIFMCLCNVVRHEVPCDAVSNKVAVE